MKVKSDIGKDEVTGSNPVISFRLSLNGSFFYLKNRISADILYSDISDGFIFDGSSLFIGGIAGNFIGIGGG